MSDRFSFFRTLLAGGLFLSLGLTQPATAQFGGFLKKATDELKKDVLTIDGVNITDPNSIRKSFEDKVSQKISGKFKKILSGEDLETQQDSVEKTIYSGKNHSWSNPDTGAHGENKVVGEKTKTKKKKIPVLKDQVEQVPPLDLVGINYQAVVAAKVRGGPGGDYKIVDQLEPQEVVNVVGRVVGSDWVMISSGGAGSGFVYGELLTPAPDKDITDAGPAGGEVKTVKAKVQQTCKVIEQSVTGENGKTKVEKIKVCEGPNGWEIA